MSDAPSLPLRAWFERLDRSVDPLQVIVGGTVGIPVPLPRRRHPSGLPRHVAIEVRADAVRILDADGGVREEHARGALAARVRWIDEDGVELDVRRPDGSSAALRAPGSPEAAEVVELLARDARVAGGGDAEADAALMRLAADTLPPPLREDRQAALRAVTNLLGPGERPLALAGAYRGLASGVAVLTDRALSWWGGGRRAAVVLPRREIAAASAATVAGTAELRIDDAHGRTTVLGMVEPPGRAAEIAAALAAERPPPGGLDAYLSAERDEGVVRLVRRDLEALRALWQEGEEGRVLAFALCDGRRGALMLTDRRLLWASRKADGVAIAREGIADAAVSRRLGAARLDVGLAGGGTRRLEAIEPRERADAIAAALVAEQPGA